MTASTSAPRQRGRPPRIAPSRQETREALIRCGTELLTEKAFLSTGLDEMLKRAGVAKGSFYHYFASKDTFGLLVVDNYDACFCRKLDRLLLAPGTPPLTRLAAFMQEGMDGMRRHDFRRGCLIGNLAQELASLHEGFRLRLQQAFAGWRQRVCTCLEAARADGEIAAETDCLALAGFFWMGWEGAVLQAKLVQDAEPLTVFAAQFFSLLGRPDRAPAATADSVPTVEDPHVQSHPD
ncbi:TetR/AcrR family transcriptional regulator [Paludibacterium yongneupense]|uniref:acrylate utilization transcriptional regulator AcuR n=1 Tax=Paludibacterium yongneupense TaxID=400061 RepID=UPI000A0340EE|nr:TetR/AcrR family transcriptional regulator [Paludibacterium yongneupense]